ncbi:hypothetical protein QEN19_002890 [Hanseniaspora menglaensis]
MFKGDADLEKAIKKACSGDESAPKRKHVRTCIVYTYDHKSAKAVFSGMQAFLSQTALKGASYEEDIRIFKMLITIHKVIQEGHKSSITEGIRNMEWIQSLGGRFAGAHNAYGDLIYGYVNFLLSKLKFHRNNKGFSGTFEYEEYISLRTVDDPNQGYESILDLMELQRKLFKFSRIIFSNLSNSETRSECKISALVPLVSESYGVYKFITSMLRAMFKQTGDDDALLPLKDSFEAQHSDLFKFYSKCSSLDYLSTLITIPKLPINPPNVFNNENGSPAPEQNVADNVKVKQEPNIAMATPPLPPQVSQEPTQAKISSQPTGIAYWQTQQLQFQQEQQLLEQERQSQLLQQQQQHLLFEEQQKAAQMQQEQQMHMLQQQQTGAINSLQNDLISFRNQYDQDQVLLQQYDQRVQQLESEIENINNNANLQIQNKDGHISALSEESKTWKTKYESLAKLYSQLRQEHLNLLSKFKKLQQRAASASEAIEKKEKLERDLKAKNIELADLIRERDRARLDNDKIIGQRESDTDKLELEIRDLKRKLKDQEELNSANLTKIFQQHQQELDSLRVELGSPTSSINQEIAALKLELHEKTEELDITQQTMEETIQQLAANQKESEMAVDEQIDEVLKAHLQVLSDIVDSVLIGGISTVQDLLFDLMNNDLYSKSSQDPNVIVAAVFLAVEKCEDQATEFSTAFNDFLAEGPKGDYTTLIITLSQFTNCLSDLTKNCKNLSNHVALDDEQSDSLLSLVGRVLRESEYFLEDLQADSLNEEGNSIEEKQDVVISGNVDLQVKLEDLANYVEGLSITTVDKPTSDNLSVAVDNELNETHKTILDATNYIPNLLASADFSGELGEVNKNILEYALKIVHAILKLINSSTICQEEIVSNSDSLLSRAEFYKKNNRWSEGLISAAKAVGQSTKLLIATADGLLKQENSFEEFMVCSKDVAASTAQLVAASRVKSSAHSKSQQGLEESSKDVSECCKKLLQHIRLVLNNSSSGLDIDFSALSVHENKTIEMEQQVEILKLETLLDKARKRLGDIRQHSYKAKEEEGIVDY